MDRGASRWLISRPVWGAAVGDIKLFKLDVAGAAEIKAQSVLIEKQLQTVLEKNLEAFLGVRFLASEYATGKTHRGRIDSLGIDENQSPVIIEYKRSQNENVINQGLFYLDWLLDHRGEFELLAIKRLGKVWSGDIDWAGSRLICIAYDFTRYDEHAVAQIDRNIELIRYRRYGPDLMLFELVNPRTGAHGGDIPVTTSKPGAKPGKGPYKTVSERLASSSSDLQGVYHGLRNHLVSLDDVEVKVTKQYVAFRRLKNFASVDVLPQAGKLLVYVKQDPQNVQLEAGFTRDVRSIGHYGTGDLEITITSTDDLERAMPLVMASYADN